MRAPKKINPNAISLVRTTKDLVVAFFAAPAGKGIC
jgi:hypothetical protein